MDIEEADPGELQRLQSAIDRKNCWAEGQLKMPSAFRRSFEMKALSQFRIGILNQASGSNTPFVFAR
jgi:hypothetical protein